MQQLYTLIIFSENLAGVLNAVTNVFTRRMLNIESLSANQSGTKGIHRYTLTCKTDEETIKLVTKQIEKKVDVIKAQYFTTDQVYVMEQALYKIATPRLLANREISKAIRQYDGKMVEVNPTYTIVSKEGMPDEITALYEGLEAANCLLQFVRSGIVAVTKADREELLEFLDLREMQRMAHEQA